MFKKKRATGPRPWPGLKITSWDHDRIVLTSSLEMYKLYTKLRPIKVRQAKQHRGASSENGTSSPWVFAPI